MHLDGAFRLQEAACDRNYPQSAPQGLNPYGFLPKREGCRLAGKPSRWEDIPALHNVFALSFIPS